ncbi:DUF4221 family protein [Flavivirga algicola]|uniref:DUF4221 family protein n=1 Tax=Flavivirga algicola TaxID=2729136 RepID=A0ABX1S294_9FLAO|nr:DUF4221 family protein [Flavivirga algicola]NMH89375.1 DUF4221 family protein [Flavivirga algicola]
MLNFSCKKNVNVSRLGNNIDIELKDSLVFKVPEGVYISDIYWNFSKTKVEEPFFLNSDFPIERISKYNLKNDDWDILKFEEDGPHGIGNANGFHYVSEDSIFVFNGHEKEFYLFNNKLEINKKFKIQGGNFSVNLHSYFKPALRNYVFYLPGVDFVRFDKPSGVNNAYAFLKIDLITGKQEKIIKYPDEFKDKVWKREYLIPKFILLDKRIIVSFGSSDYLYVYNLDGKLVKKVFAKSSKINPLPLKSGESNNSYKAHYNYLSNGFYSYIHYDENNEVFYRLAQHLPKHIDKEEKYLINFLDLSLLVFDKELNLLKEYEVSSKISGYNSFLDDGYLYLNKKPHLEYGCLEDLDECRTFYKYTIL